MSKAKIINISQKCKCGGNVCEKLATYGEFRFTIWCEDCHFRVQGFEESVVKDAFFNKSDDIRKVKTDENQRVDVAIWRKWVPPVLNCVEENNQNSEEVIKN